MNVVYKQSEGHICYSDTKCMSMVFLFCVACMKAHVIVALPVPHNQNTLSCIKTNANQNTHIRLRKHEENDGLYDQRSHSVYIRQGYHIMLIRGKLHAERVDEQFH